MDAPWRGELKDARGRFFAVLHTTRRTQTATMTVAPGQEAGPAEVHEGEDQVFLFLDGEAEVKVWERGEGKEPERARMGPGGVLVVPAGMRHWVKSVGREPLFFFTVYGPPAYGAGESS
jgi:mannose-6-phosphate isomerase-like protein (cupin superfamily)